MHTDFDQDLRSYFTNVEHLRDSVKLGFVSPALPKRLLIIHGVGGVGKSSLLRMFRLDCKALRIPVAFASGDEDKSGLHLMVRWREDLKTSDLRFPSFDKTLRHYRTVQAKIDDQAKRGVGGRAIDIAGKAASKTAEAAGGALAGAAVGSVIPGIGIAIGGAFGGALGGMGTEALVDWLRSFLKRSDIELVLDPVRKLTEGFLADLASAANRQRIVLMLDTYEQITPLENWMCEVAQRLHTNIMLVIAGRTLPNWSCVWPSWMAYAQVEELEPMTERDMHDLARRYYATMHDGEPDLKQVEAITRFARGLPIVVTGAIQLWVKYGVEDFQAVKPEIVANLVDRLTEGVPKEMAPFLEAAAIVRWFDQPILRAVTNLSEVREAFNELRRFPFVRSRTEGLAFHDAVREMLDENLRTQDSERHRELHLRAAAYFRAQAAKEQGTEMAIQQLYHELEVDEAKGVSLLRSLFENAISSYDIETCDFLVAEAKGHSFRRPENRRLLEQYEAFLLLTRNRWSEAVDAYYSLLSHPDLDHSMRLVATKHIGFALNKLNRLDELAKFYHECIDLCDELGEMREKAHALTDLAEVRHRQGDYVLAAEACGESIALCEEIGEEGNGLAYSLNILGLLYRFLGRWEDAANCHQRSIATYRKLNNEWGVGTALHNLGHIFRLQHRLHEAAISFLEGMRIFDRVGDEYWSANCEYSLGGIHNERSEWATAHSRLTRCLEVKTRLNDDYGASKILSWLGYTYWHLGQEAESQECYQKAIATVRQRMNLEKQCEYLTEFCLLRYYEAHDFLDIIAPHLLEAEQTAQENGFWDHLARCRAIRAHAEQDNGFKGVALQQYQESLLYALRYNRYLLDEITGRIIRHCSERNGEGRQMMIALLNWWKTGDVAAAMLRTDTISPDTRSIPLLEAERNVREHEPGEGSPQMGVTEQIMVALNRTLTGQHDAETFPSASAGSSTLNRC